MKLGFRNVAVNVTSVLVFQDFYRRPARAVGTRDDGICLPQKRLGKRQIALGYAYSLIG